MSILLLAVPGMDIVVGTLGLVGFGYISLAIVLVIAAYATVWR